MGELLVIEICKTSFGRVEGRNFEGGNVEGRNVEGRNVEGRNVEGRNGPLAVG
jgi:hypothetical protein